MKVFRLYIQALISFLGDDYVHTFKYGTNMWGFNFMQTVGRNLVLGFELLNMVKNTNK